MRCIENLCRQRTTSTELEIKIVFSIRVPQFDSFTIALKRAWVTLTLLMHDTLSNFGSRIPTFFLVWYYISALVKINFFFIQCHFWCLSALVHTMENLIEKCFCLSFQHYELCTFFSGSLFWASNCSAVEKRTVPSA